MFTARALVLGVVAGLAFVLVYPTAQSYLAQRARLTSAQQELAEARLTNANLENELERWSDPAYVTSQARSRLSFVMPGERAYRVVDPDVAVEPVTVGDGPTGTLTGPSRVWYVDVWTSVTIAGEAGEGR